MTLACQDSKVLLVSLDLRVSMEGQVAQVSPDLLVDQESLADLEDRDCQVTRAKRVVMEFQDHQESKESLDFLDLVARVHLDFQDYQVQRETQVFPGPLVSLDSQVLKERPVSPVPLVLLATLVLLGHQDKLFRDPKDLWDHQDHQEEEVRPARRVPVDLQEVAE